MWGDLPFIGTRSVQRHAPRNAGHPRVIRMSASRQLPNAHVGIPVHAELSGAALMENSEVCDQLCTIKSKALDSSAQKHGLTELGHPSTLPRGQAMQTNPCPQSTTETYAQTLPWLDSQRSCTPCDSTRTEPRDVLRAPAQSGAAHQCAWSVERRQD